MRAWSVKAWSVERDKRCDALTLYAPTLHAPDDSKGGYCAWTR
jgi:hypothetical protein